MLFYDDDDDFQAPLTQIATPKSLSISQKTPKSSSFTQRPPKRAKRSKPSGAGKENVPFPPVLKQSAVRESSDCLGNLGSKYGLDDSEGFESLDGKDCSLDSIPSSFDCSSVLAPNGIVSPIPEETIDVGNVGHSSPAKKKGLLEKIGGHSCNSIESKLMKSRGNCGFTDVGDAEISSEDSEGELDELLKLCSELEDRNGVDGGHVGHYSEGDGLVDDGTVGLVRCPLCGVDISDLSEEERHLHSNDCLDKEEAQAQDVVCASKEGEPQKSRQLGDVSAVVEWLRNLGLAKYEDVFVREEVDWDTLQWLTEEDLLSIGITALGPRKKIVHALSQLKKGDALVIEADTSNALSVPGRSNEGVDMPSECSEQLVDGGTTKIAANKLITDYFPGSATDRKKVCKKAAEQRVLAKKGSSSGRKQVVVKNHAMGGRLKNAPLWCCIPGTPFRVDAFRYLRGSCSHWFLTHFHMDHYQGLTKSFCHGKIYCSSITATLVNMKIGIPWDRLQVLPLNQKFNILGIDVMCLDANHCPGAVILLFEPPNGKAVLHTGDFRFDEDGDIKSILQARAIHTLILDTTYCNSEYDFPKQEAVIQFVIDAIQAESFNPKTLFLIGSYTIGKERLFLEVARVLRKKVYVTAAKLRILKCLGFPQEDMQWFTLNEQESHIHVVPMWTLASFKRLKHISNQYMGRYSLIVAFSPTGWTFVKGKKKSPGRKWQQGTIIRYEVPYSEHSSFSELKEFVKLVSPENIIPHVNNHGQESANAMVSLLLS
ncbi:hypothetical protein UlMin_035796 [Ulmus minor]